MMWWCWCTSLCRYHALALNVHLLSHFACREKSTRVKLLICVYVSARVSVRVPTCVPLHQFVRSASWHCDFRLSFRVRSGSIMWTRRQTDNGGRDGGTDGLTDRQQCLGLVRHTDGWTDWLTANERRGGLWLAAVPREVMWYSQGIFDLLTATWIHYYSFSSAHNQLLYRSPTVAWTANSLLRMTLYACCGCLRATSPFCLIGIICTHWLIHVKLVLLSL